MRGDIKNQVSVAQSIAPGNHTSGDSTGSGVDLANFDAAVVVLDVGTVSDGAFSIEVQDAADDGSGSPDTWEAVADDDLDGSEPGTLSADTVTEIGYHGRRRHLRVVATDGGTGNADFGASVVRALPRNKPQS